MIQTSKKVTAILADMQNVQADDPDMIAKLNEIAQKVAEAQSRILWSSQSQVSNFKNIDPMEELGCEGCQ
jgi:hypothetical protein